MDVINRFTRYYFGDQTLTRLEVDVENRRVSMVLTGALLLRSGENPSIFDPEVRLSPAVVQFTDCQEVQVSSGTFAMNNTVVEFSAVPLSETRTAFRFSLTGGSSNETFWRELTFVAGDFVVIGEESPASQKD